MNTKQIAQEARIAIFAAYRKWPDKELTVEVDAIIRAAIEKVDEQWRERFRKFEKIEEKFGPASQRAARASEERPTEGTHAEEQWTEETVRMIIADVPVGDAPEIIAAAHNAAIEKADTESYREGVAAGIATTLQEQQPKASPSHCPACNGDELAKIGDEWVECPGIQPKSE